MAPPISASLFPPSTVQHIASSSSLSIPSLNANVASALAADTEHRLRILIQDAEKLMRHGRRQKLTCQDVKRALELKGLEPVYGFVNGSGQRQRYRKTMAGGNLGGVVYQVEEQEIDIDAIAASVSSHYPATQPRKGGVGWKAHWLAVEGVQPLVPENPAPAQLGGPLEDETNQNDPYGSVPAQIANGTSNTMDAASASGAVAQLSNASKDNATKDGSLGVNAQVQPLVKHILSRELQVYYQRLTEAIMHGIESETSKGAAEDAHGDSDMTGQGQGADGADRLDAVSLAALSSLRSDPGLHQLLPYLCQWISSTVSAALAATDGSDTVSNGAQAGSSRRNAVVHRMLSTIESILLNQELGVESYIHLLLPPVLSCVLISLPSSTNDNHNGYTVALRKKAAELVGLDILRRFAPRYPSLRPRIARILLEAVFAGVGQQQRSTGNGEPKPERDDEPTEGEDAPRPSLGTKLGAILALEACGGGMPRALLRAKSTRQGPGGPLLVNEGQRQIESEEQAVSSGEPFGGQFKRLGEWIRSHSVDDEGRAGDSTSREEIIEAVKRILHEMARSRDDVVEDRWNHEQLIERFGTFWVEQVGQDDEARRGLVVGVS